MKKISLTVMTAFLSALTWAQDATKSVDVNINTKSGNAAWYTNPIVWVVGAAVFILLLVALSRGRNRD
ncbi:MAG: hypothetical protein EOO16_18700 [Chitinophagaceae bacterium]|nr:MAG: hypothetical protein EOO16_18700 [Chitinophagaceae bacterium]